MAINTLKNSCFTFIIFSVTEDRESLARLEVQNRALSQQLRCRVCHQAAIDTILMPCRHLVVCETCTRSMTSCPLCQDTIRAVVRVHVEWSGKTYNDSDIHFMIDLLLWVVPNSKCCFCGHSLCDCSLQQLKLQTGSITATLSSIVLVGTPSEYLSVLRYNPPAIPNKQAWELSAKMQILMAVKLTFHGEKYVVRGEKRSVVQKKRKKKVPHWIPVKHMEHIHLWLLPVLVTYLWTQLLAEHYSHGLATGLNAGILTCFCTMFWLKKIESYKSFVIFFSGGGWGGLDLRVFLSNQFPCLNKP